MISVSRNRAKVEFVLYVSTKYAVTHGKCSSTSPKCCPMPRTMDVVAAVVFRKQAWREYSNGIGGALICNQLVWMVTGGSSRIGTERNQRGRRCGMGGTAKQCSWIAKGCKAVAWAHCKQSWSTENSRITVSSEAVSLSLLLEPWWMKSACTVARRDTTRVLMVISLPFGSSRR